MSAFVTSFTRIAVAWTLVVAGLMAGAFFGKVGADFSRVWIATWYVSALLMLFGERLAVAQFVKSWVRKGRLNRRAVIVGGGHKAEELIKALEASHEEYRQAARSRCLAPAPRFIAAALQCNSDLGRPCSGSGRRPACY